MVSSPFLFTPTDDTPVRESVQGVFDVEEYLMLLASKN
jgi:hypothetical protein